MRENQRVLITKIMSLSERIRDLIEHIVHLQREDSTFSASMRTWRLVDIIHGKLLDYAGELRELSLRTPGKFFNDIGNELNIAYDGAQACAKFIRAVCDADIPLRADIQKKLTSASEVLSATYLASLLKNANLLKERLEAETNPLIIRSLSAPSITRRASGGESAGVSRLASESACEESVENDALMRRSHFK